MPPPTTSPKSSTSPTTPSSTPPTSPPRALQHLLGSPHRLAFLAAMGVLAGSALWWAAAQWAAWQGVPWRWALPPALAHGLVMSLGFMPLFFTGFLFTAGPRWLQVPAVAARALVLPVGLQAGGWALFGLGVHRPLAWPDLAAAGVSLVALGWAGVVWRFLRLLRQSRAPDQAHARLLAAGGLLGLAALAGAAAGLATGHLAWTRAALLGGLWGFAGSMFATAIHRMVPFFAAPAWAGMEAWRPLWLLGVLLPVLGWQAVDAVLGATAAFPFPAPVWHATQAAVALPAGLGLLVLSLRWSRVFKLKLPLVAMLHAGVTWLGVALGLQGASQLMQAWGDARFGAGLGLAPLHALALGFLGTVMLAMVSRISVGHAGPAGPGRPRPAPVADAWLWRLFLLLQGVALLRVLLAATAAFPGLPAPLRPAGLAAAATGWAALCLAWAWRYGRGYAGR